MTTPDAAPWPFKYIKPEDWRKLPDDLKIRIEGYAQGAISVWEDDHPPRDPAPAQRLAA